MKSLFPLLLLGTILLTNSLQAQDSDFFKESDSFFKLYAQHNAVKYKELYQRPNALENLVKQVETYSLEGQNTLMQKAFYINAYNLLVISTVVEHYPITSPNEVVDFWDAIEHQVAGNKYTLEALENFILRTYEDPQLHFALSNGSVACPPIANFAYQPEALEEQLRQRVIGAVNNSQWIQYHPKLEQLELPLLFRRHQASFQPNVVAYLNKYRLEKVDAAAHLTYTNEDWSLNSYHEATSVLRKKRPKKADKLSEKGLKNIYGALAQVLTLPKGTAEFMDFNSIYTVEVGNRDNGSRNTYFNSYFSAFYGVTGTLDIGMCLLFRASRERDYFNTSPFRVLTMEQSGNKRLNNTPANIFADRGLSHMGFQVRFAPFKSINLSFEHGFMLPIESIPNENRVDQSIYSVTQVYYIHPLANKTQLFLALTYWQGFRPGKKFNFQIPLLRGYINYFPTSRLSLYLTSMYLLEWGCGVKYLLTPKFEVQLMYSYYLPIPGAYSILAPGASSVMTYNVGFRYRL